MRTFSVTTWREGKWVVAQCLDLDVASQGRDEEEALTNLADALRLQFTPPIATILPEVRRIEVNVSQA